MSLRQGNAKITAINTAGATQVGNVNTAGNKSMPPAMRLKLQEGNTQVARVADVIDSKADKLTTYTSGNILVAGAGGIYRTAVYLRPQNALRLIPLLTAAGILIRQRRFYSRQKVRSAAQTKAA